MENNNDKKVKVEVVDYGPLRITGKIILKDLKRGTEQTSDYIELCRCGRSRNKPFCDGSHDKPE